MIKKNKFQMCLLITFIALSLSACSTSKDTPVRVGTNGLQSAEVEKEYDLKTGVEESDITAEVEITEWLGETSDPSEKTFFKANLVKVYKNKINPSLKEIKLMQEGNSEVTLKEYPLFKKGDKLILFLKKSADVEDTYWILGAHTSAIQVKETEGKEFAIKYVGKLDKLSNIEVNKSDSQISKALEKIDTELKQEFKNYKNSNKEGFYKELSERQIFDKELLDKELQSVK